MGMAHATDRYNDCRDETYYDVGTAHAADKYSDLEVQRSRHKLLSFPCYLAASSGLTDTAESLV